ncbi:hypothetical protein GDO81_017082 [Engystomops pustulosus]|uniref:Uncharacterized protein n=2 Tax=Engystomops pustulosus TaxID=76066 RepID=A0AAV7AEU2_ENGPU|nr:hypothetical protein GDO81_017082 [Engystomops pustulosus]
MTAVAKGHLQAAEILIKENKVDLTEKDELSNTPLHLACISGHENCALLIIDKINNENLINTTNNALQTPLHIAEQNGLKVIVEKLIEKGART